MMPVVDYYPIGLILADELEGGLGERHCQAEDLIKRSRGKAIRPLVLPLVRFYTHARSAIVSQ